MKMFIKYDENIRKIKISYHQGYILQDLQLTDSLYSHRHLPRFHFRFDLLVLFFNLH